MNAIQKKLLDMNSLINIIMFVGLVILIAMSAVLSSDMYVPALPAIAYALHTSASEVQLSVTYYLAGLALGQLIFGPLSDKYGRKPMLLIGLGLGVLGSIYCLGAHNVSHLLLGRIGQGLGMAATLGLSRTMLSDQFDGQRLAKLGSYFSFSFAIFPVISPTFGSYIAHALGWRAVFVSIAIWCVFAWLLTAFILPETNRHKKSTALELPKLLEHYKKIFSHKAFWAYTVSSGVAIGGIFAYYTVSPFLFQSVLGLSSIQYGWLSIIIVAAMLIGRGANVPLLRFLSPNKMIFLGNTLVLIGALMMALTASMNYLSVVSVLIPMLVFIVGGGLIFSNALAMAFKPFRHIAGLLGSIYGTVQMGIAFLASCIASHVSHTTQAGLAGILVTFSAVSFLLFYNNVYRHQSSFSYLTQKA